MAKRKKISQKSVFYIRKYYTIAFNIYAWYWLYKIVFILPFDLENYITWTFACFGMWFFVIDSSDDEFKKDFNDSPGYPELINDIKH